MIAGRFIIAQFCDDIRQEVGNKFSLMGCYGHELLVENVPAVLPKLCVHIKAVTPHNAPFKRLVFRVCLNDQVFMEKEIPPDDLEKGQNTFKENESGERLGVMFAMAFAPFGFTERTEVRVEAETEDGIIRGTKIVLRANTSSSANA